MYIVQYNALVFHTVCRSKDDLDFDEFLESVKARQQSMTTSKTKHTLAYMYTATSQS